MFQLFFSLLGAFSEGLVFCGRCRFVVLVLCLVLEAIGELTWSVALLTNSRLEIEKM